MQATLKEIIQIRICIWTRWQIGYSFKITPMSCDLLTLAFDCLTCESYHCFVFCD